MKYKIESDGMSRNKKWAVMDEHGTLVCLCCYLKGATEVVRRLMIAEGEPFNAPYVRKVA